MSNRTIRYPLDKFSDCSDGEGKKILAFSIRTTDGTDEAHASKEADARGTGMTEELIRFSMVSYEVEEIIEDKKASKVVDIKHPFTTFDGWSTKARNFVVAAWKRLSTPDEKEIADFFAHGSEVE